MYPKTRTTRIEIVTQGFCVRDLVVVVVVDSLTIFAFKGQGMSLVGGTVRYVTELVIISVLFIHTE